MFKDLIDRVGKAAGSIWALWVLGVVSFLESAFLPIPVDPFALPIMLVNRRRLWQAALVASLASVAGGAMGYMIGALLMDSLGGWLVSSLAMESQFEAFSCELRRNGGWIVFFGALTPIPFKIVAIAAGAIKFSLISFFAAATAGRVLRFFTIASAIYFLGNAINKYMKENSLLVTALIVIVTILGFIGVYYLVPTDYAGCV